MGSLDDEMNRVKAAIPLVSGLWRDLTFALFATMISNTVLVDKDEKIHRGFDWHAVLHDRQ